MHPLAEKSVDRIKKSHFKVTVGLAQNEDSDEVQRLVEEAGFKEKLDWSNIYPYWVIALNDGKAIGCLQVCPGRPVGRLEMLATDKGLSGTQRAQTVVRLLEQGVRTLKLDGSQMASGMIGHDHKSYKKLIKRRGGIVVDTGNLMAMKI